MIENTAVADCEDGEYLILGTHSSSRSWKSLTTCDRTGQIPRHIYDNLSAKTAYPSEHNVLLTIRSTYLVIAHFASLVEGGTPPGAAVAQSSLAE